MKNILRLEELAQLLLGIFAFGFFNLEWWWFLVFFFLPDLSMIGYAAGNRIGAFLYNLCHHKGVTLLFFFSGFYSGSEAIQVTGIILFAHSAFDRMLGYGLKYTTGFRFTHLGEIGKKSEKIYK